MVLIGNFGLEAENINPEFTQTGTWYDYFSGEEIEVNNTTENISLAAGEWHIYTTDRLSDGFPGVVEVYDNPVTITPFPFTKGQEITIRFDATKASPAAKHRLAKLLSLSIGEDSSTTAPLFSENTLVLET